MLKNQRNIFFETLKETLLFLKCFYNFRENLWENLESYAIMHK